MSSIYRSNYPPGVTGADFESDILGDIYECFGCSGEIYEDDDPPTELVGKKYCRECRKACPSCGEMFDDDSVAASGPLVTFRWYATRGQRQTEHATCAATTILNGFADDEFDPDTATRETIAELVAAQMEVLSCR